MNANTEPWSGAGPSAAPPLEATRDGWIGLKELPGYRAGKVVVKLDNLPGVDAEHLYLDLLLLDASGRTQDNHSGPCLALGRDPSLDDRSRFVRVVAELLRHALDDAPGLSAISQALRYIREQGVATAQLIAATQLLDAACSERALALSLQHLLTWFLGEDEARAVLAGVLHQLGSTANGASLYEQIDCVVRTVGKARARRLLREATEFNLVPDADMFLI